MCHFLFERVRLLGALVFLLLFWAAPLVAVAQGDGATVRGRVFEDLDGDGQWDDGEPPLVGRAVALSNPPSTFALTNAEGMYEFTGVPLGLNGVGPLFDTDYMPTSPPSGYVEFDVPNLGPINIEPIGLFPRCGELKVLKALCDPFRPNEYVVTFQFTNISNFDVSYLYFNFPSPAGVVVSSTYTATDNFIPFSTPIPSFGSTTFVATIKNLAPGQEVCWTMSAHHAAGDPCCFFRFCFRAPLCDCAQIIDEEIICNPDGTSYTYCFTIQNLVTSPRAMTLQFVPPGSVGMNPVTIPLNPTGSPPGLGYGDTYQVCVTISNLPPGTKRLCFGIRLLDALFRECCQITHCVDLPDCGCTQTPGRCAAGRPHYINDLQSLGFLPSHQIAVVTCWGTELPGMPPDPVLAIYNLGTYQCFPPPQLGSAWVNPPGPIGGFHGFNESWNVRNLGHIFGLTLDDQGNIYVCHSSSYEFAKNPLNIPGNLNHDRVGPGGPGAIYRINTNSAAIETFVGIGAAGFGFFGSTLPNFADAPNGSVNRVDETGAGGYLNVTDSYPGLGNISFDYDERQLFVTNFEDGRIYRVSMNGQVLDFHDPLLPDDGRPGFAPLGERLWAVEYHDFRVYYSVWTRDSGRCDYSIPGPYQNTMRQDTTRQNQIRSVAIYPSGALKGQFIPGSDRLEIGNIPPTVGYASFAAMPGLCRDSAGNRLPFSNPVSDISFSPEGYMMLAERTMTNAHPSWQPPGPSFASGDTTAWGHESRALEYRCGPTGTWELYTRSGVPVDLAFSVGQKNLVPRSTAGGVDYDYSRCCENEPNPFGRRVWFTADYAGPAFPLPGTYNAVYGLAGLPRNGGDQLDSILLDADHKALPAKTHIGDVEIPCPPECGGVFGAIIVSNGGGHPTSVDVVLRPQGLPPVNMTIGVGANGQFAIGDLLPVPYDIRFKATRALAKVVPADLSQSSTVELTIELINGDIDGDNEIGISDFALLSVAFGSEPGSPNWNENADLDCDAMVDIADFSILSANFGMQGDD